MRSRFHQVVADVLATDPRTALVLADIGPTHLTPARPPGAAWSTSASASRR
mgnify:CR=1 FL=1